MSTGFAEEEYVCKLDEKTLKKAIEELNEDPKNRLGAVETFRQWIVQQPHIKCPTDTAFLLTFLRVRYFSQLEARKLLVNYLTKRTEHAKWFRDVDPCDKKIQAVLDDGFIIPLPGRDDEGRRVVIVKFGNFFPKHGYSTDDYFRACTCLFDYVYQMDEMTCVNGTSTICDMGSFSMKQYTIMSNSDRKEYAEVWQSNFPARIKQLHIYNLGAMAELIMSLFKLIMSDKHRQRIIVHGQVLEGIYKDVPKRMLPVEYLPDDYTGPNAGTERQLIENFKNDLMKPEVRARLLYLSSGEFGIFEQKTKKKNLSDYVEPPQASFRKLNID